MGVGRHNLMVIGSVNHLNQNLVVGPSRRKALIRARFEAQAAHIGETVRSAICVDAFPKVVKAASRSDASQSGNLKASPIEALPEPKAGAGRIGFGE